MDTIAFPDVVELNVGGKLMTTLLITLTKDPDSMLSAMFSGRHVISKDKDGRFFIDCNGKLFEYILNFLRYGSLPPKEKALEMYDIAVYFNVQSLAKSLENYHSVQYRKGINQIKSSLDVLEYDNIKQDALSQLYNCYARPEDEIVVLFMSRQVNCSVGCLGNANVYLIGTNISVKHGIILKVNDTKEMKKMKLCIAHDLNAMGFGKFLYIHYEAMFTCKRCRVTSMLCSHTALLSSYKIIDPNDSMVHVSRFV